MTPEKMQEMAKGVVAAVKAHLAARLGPLEARILSLELSSDSLRAENASLKHQLELFQGIDEEAQRLRAVK